jgi:hypothetical protein
MIVFEVRQRIKSRFLGFGQKSQVVVEGAVNGRHHGYWAGEAIPARRRKREHRESNQILRIGHCSTTAWGVSYRRVKLRGKRVSTDFETSLFPPDTDYEAIERIIESPLDGNPWSARKPRNAVQMRMTFEARFGRIRPPIPVQTRRLGKI